MNHKMYRDCVYMYIHNGIIDDIILLMLKLLSNTIDTYLTLLLRHERYLFSVFHGILPAIFRRFSKKLSTSVVVHQTIFDQIIKINKGPYMELIVPSSFYCIDARLHALSFSPGFNVYKLYLK
jgi:predicted transcriptional regulator